MKTILRAIAAAFSTFSVLPMPPADWNEDGLRGLLGALPLVGAVIGGFDYLYYLLAQALSLPDTLSAAVLTALPLAVSGGIHMDGFADTVDALASHGTPERKRAILKDPHAGAFSVTGVGCWLLLSFGLYTALPLRPDLLLLLGLTFVLARTAGALAGTLLPASGQTGMLAAFRAAADRGTVRALGLWAVLSLAAAAALMPLAAVVFLLVSAGVFFYVKRMARRQFGGMSGDLAGFCVCLSELALLLGLVISERMVTLWF